MPRKELPKPPGASFPVWKMIFAAMSLGAIFIFPGWLFKFIWEPGRYAGFRSDPPSFPPLTVNDILLGSGFVPLFLWIRWAWQPRRKHGRWHRWFGSLGTGVYLSVLILLGGTASWNALLSPPWNWVVNGILVVLLALAWVMPALSYRWAEKLAGAQDDLGLKMLAYGGPAGLMVLAGILGANFGTSASRNGEMGTGLFAMAFGFSLAAILVAQYNAAEFWPYRPWAKEEDEE